MFRVARSGLSLLVSDTLFARYHYYYREVSYDFPVYL
jgi:hypothetical protein